MARKLRRGYRQAILYVADKKMPLSRHFAAFFITPKRVGRYTDDEQETKTVCSIFILLILAKI